jgi:hypothetical protein
MTTMKLSDIKIRKCFANSIPKESKIDKCRKNWKKTGQQDRELVITKDGVLLDGYIQYLVLKENSIDDVTVCVKKLNWRDSEYRNKETMYIFGHHPNDKTARTYIWRVPETWSDFKEHIEVGDTVYVDTKFGNRRVVIDKIDVLNSCPIDMPVRKMASKIIEKSGEK